MSDMKHLQEEVILKIESMKAQLYPECVFMILFGSYAKGEQAQRSDIDLIVVYNGIAEPTHQKISFENQDYDIFVFDVETLNATLQHAIRHGEFVLVDGVIEGVVLPCDNKISQALKSIALRIRQEGFVFNDVKKARHFITGLLQDIQKDRPAIDKNMLAVEIYRATARVLLIVGGAGICNVKSAPKFLRQINPSMFEKLDQALILALQQNHQDLINIADEVLNSIGGPLSEGYRVKLKSDVRIPLVVPPN